LACASASTGQHEFAQLCADLGIDHRLTPPMRPQTNGMVERFNGRIEDVLQSHRFQSGEDLEQTILRYVALYNSQLPQSALASRTPLQAMKDWHKLRPELFKNSHTTSRDVTPNVNFFTVVKQTHAVVC
jgi:transposase InsO family protein